MRTLDVPQANDLDTVRSVVYAIGEGASRFEEIEEMTGYSHRHIGYRVHAARILKLIDQDRGGLKITRLGARLLQTRRESRAERMIYKEAVEESPSLRILVPDLLSCYPPSLHALTQRLFDLCGLSHNTAQRRAGGLLSWRRRILGLTCTPRAFSGVARQQMTFNF